MVSCMAELKVMDGMAQDDDKWGLDQSSPC